MEFYSLKLSYIRFYLKKNYYYYYYYYFMIKLKTNTKKEGREGKPFLNHYKILNTKVP